MYHRCEIHWKTGWTIFFTLGEPLARCEPSMIFDYFICSHRSGHHCHGHPSLLCVHRLEKQTKGHPEYQQWVDIWPVIHRYFNILLILILFSDGLTLFLQKMFVAVPPSKKEWKTSVIIWYFLSLIRFWNARCTNYGNFYSKKRYWIDNLEVVDKV